MNPIHVRDLTYVYGDGRQALSGLSLEVGAGEVVGLLGRNGAGKTTLLRCLLGLLRPAGGVVANWLLALLAVAASFALLARAFGRTESMAFAPGPLDTRGRPGRRDPTARAVQRCCWSALSCGACRCRP